MKLILQQRREFLKSFCVM